MEKIKELEDSIIKIRKDFSSIREDIGNYIQPKIGAILSEEPHPTGCIRWRANFDEDKRVYIDLYAIGVAIFDFQTRLSQSEKTSLDTSRDFLEPNMEQNMHNFVNLYVPGQLDLLVQKIREHFAGVNAE